MEQPPGYLVDGHARVYRFIKNLYDQRQAPSVWNKTQAEIYASGFRLRS